MAVCVCVHAPACMCSHLRVHRDLSLHQQSWPVKRSAYVDRVTYSKDKHQTYTYPGTGFFFFANRETQEGVHVYAQPYRFTMKEVMYTIMKT